MFFLRNDQDPYRSPSKDPNEGVWVHEISPIYEGHEFRVSMGWITRPYTDPRVWCKDGFAFWTYIHPEFRADSRTWNYVMDDVLGYEVPCNRITKWNYVMDEGLGHLVPCSPISIKKCPRCGEYTSQGLYEVIPKFKGRELAWANGIPFRTQESHDFIDAFLSHQEANPVCRSCHPRIVAEFQQVSDLYEISRLSRRLKDESHARNARNQKSQRSQKGALRGLPGSPLQAS